jgi:RNA polymerase sigma-70 factor (ECF subfamily)
MVTSAVTNRYPFRHKGMVVPLDRKLQDSDARDETGSDGKTSASDGAGQSAWRFRLAMAQHHRTIYKVCYSLLRDAQEAEDVTQETFLKYWQLSSEVRGAKAWLITVARNKCLDRLRSTKRIVDADPEIFEQQQDPRDPEWQAQQDETAARLQALVAELPEPQRSLILLFDMQGLTGAECAEVLDLNINQVKVYLHRARRRLRNALEERRD